MALPYMVCADPESGTDHSSRSVHALYGIGLTHHWGIQGSCHKYVSAIFYPHLCMVLLFSLHFNNAAVSVADPGFQKGEGAK